MTKYSGALSIWLTIAGLSVAALSGCSRESRKANTTAKADEYFKAGEYEKAEIEYKNVLQLDRLDSHSYGRLGAIYFEQGRPIQAAPFLKQAVELQAENLEAKTKFGYVNLTFGNRPAAREAAMFVLERKPNDPDAPLLLVESMSKPTDAAEVRAILEKLPSAGTAPVLTALGFINLREGKFPEAERLLERAREVDPKFVPCHAALAAVYLAQKDPVRAEKMLTTAVELAPPRSPTRLQLAQLNLQAGKPEVAKKMLDDLRRATPDFLPAYMLRAGIANTEKRYDESIELLDQVLARDPAHLDALLLTAQVRMAQRDVDNALATLEKAVARFPQVPQVRHQLGTVQLAKGDLVNANASFSEAVRLAPAFAPAVLALAQTNIRQRNFVAAINSLEAFLKQNPKSTEAQLLLADAYRNQGNPNGALAIYRSLAQVNPTNAQLEHMIGTVLLQQGKTEEARKSFDKATELTPGFMPAVEQLVKLDLAEKQFAPARQRLEPVLAKEPANAPAHLLLAMVYLSEGNGDKAESELKRTIELQPDSAIAYSLLARHYISSNQIEKAVPTLEATAAKNPRDFGVWVTLATIHSEKKNYPAARDSYEKALAINPQLGVALNNLATLYTEQFGELDKALDLAQKARGVLPNVGETADTLGWVLYLKGQYARALPLLEESAEKLPENAEAQFHFGMAQYMMGNEAGARSSLEKALALKNEFPRVDEARQSLAVLVAGPSKSGPELRTAIDQALARRKDDPIALARLAALHEEQGRPREAVAVLESVLAANPSNTSAALNLIRLYQTQKEPAKALELAKATRTLVPSDAKLTHVLGRLAFESGDRLWSVGVLREAVRRQVENPEIHFDLGEASYSIGQVSAAEAEFQAALETNPKFSRAEKAREYIELIGLAQDPAKAATAGSSIGKALEKDPANVPALIAKAMADLNKGDAKAAKQSCEKALDRYPDFSPAKRLLTILAAAHPEDDKKALELAAKAREAFPNDADLAKAYGILLFRDGNFGRAAGLLQESARTRTDDADVMYYLGMSQRQLKDDPASTRSLKRSLELGLSGNAAVEAQKALTAAAKKTL